MNKKNLITGLICLAIGISLVVVAAQIFSSNASIDSYDSQWTSAVTSANIGGILAFIGLFLIFNGAILPDSLMISDVRKIMGVSSILEALAIYFVGIIWFFSSNYQYGSSTTLAVGFGLWYAIWNFCIFTFTLAGGVCLIKGRYIVLSIVGLIFAFVSGLVPEIAWITFPNLYSYSNISYTYADFPLTSSIMLLLLPVLTVGVVIASRHKKN
jgi:hypothetical protein